MPCLHPGRPLRLAPQDPSDELLPVRLCLLRQQAVVQRSARALFGRGGRDPHDRVLQAQLHRGAVPVVRHHSLAGLHHGAAYPRREDAAPRRGFDGYIHLKTIPEASPWLIEQAGLWADRLSINLELPTDASLRRLAPEKDAGSIGRAMGRMRERIDEARAEGRRFSPAGQSTQLVVGADEASDETVLRKSASLYRDYDLKRIYYSGFSPIPDASRALPATAPPLRREHRLYQADWLMRNTPSPSMRSRRRPTAACCRSTSTRS